MIRIGDCVSECKRTAETGSIVVRDLGERIAVRVSQAARTRWRARRRGTFCSGTYCAIAWSVAATGGAPVVRNAREPIF